MFKVALIAAAMTAASVAQAGDAGAHAPGAAVPACHAVQSLEMDCAVRILDANGDGTVSAAELAAFSAPASSADWAPLPPQRSGLDFKDAATNPDPAMPAPLDRGPPTILSALLALGAMVLLLRRRPG